MFKYLAFIPLILLVVLFTSDRGHKRVNATGVLINEVGERIYNDAAFTGEAITYHANGAIKSIEQFAQGRRSGYVRKWFSDGVLAYESFYQDGVRVGLTTSWWFNGNKRSETFYVKGKPEGEAWLWYRNGNKFKRFNFAQGQPKGLQQAWRLNGKLFSNFEYKNGRIFGLRKSNSCVGLEDENISVDYYSAQAGNF